MLLYYFELSNMWVALHVMSQVVINRLVLVTKFDVAMSVEATFIELTILIQRVVSTKIFLVGVRVLNIDYLPRCGNWLANLRLGLGLPESLGLFKLFDLFAKQQFFDLSLQLLNLANFFRVHTFADIEWRNFCILLLILLCLRRV